MGESRLELADYRRRVFALYGEVRALRARDPLAAHARWREERDRLFATHPQSALPAEERPRFRGLAYHAYAPELSFVAAVRTLPEERYDVPTSTGGVIPFVRFGAVDLPVGTLEVFWLDDYGGGVFLPFRDATSATTTYGGGRYLLDAAKGADLGGDSERLILDFNFAYHPSCYYDPRWVCPLAPPGNRLAAAITAGELVTPSTSARDVAGRAAS